MHTNISYMLSLPFDGCFSFAGLWWALWKSRICRTWSTICVWCILGGLALVALYFMGTWSSTCFRFQLTLTTQWSRPFLRLFTEDVAHRSTPCKSSGVAVNVPLETLAARCTANGTMTHMSPDGCFGAVGLSVHVSCFHLERILLASLTSICTWRMSWSHG